MRNVVTRVIGVDPDVEVDWWERPAAPGDRYLLCSDGLFNEVTEARIAATLRSLADPAEAARRAEAAWIEQQQSSLRVCERQYMEACRDLRKITDRLGAEPQQAREAAEQLSRAMLDKMLVEGDLCVRLLGEPLSDRATAHDLQRATGRVALGLAGPDGIAPDVAELVGHEEDRLPALGDLGGELDVLGSDGGDPHQIGRAHV